MTATPEHHTRKSYPGLCSALADAERVAIDLCDAIRGEKSMLIKAEDVDFLARRTRALVSAAYRSAVEDR